MTQQEDTDDISLNRWKERKDECRIRLFDMDSNKEQILVDYAEGEIHRSHNRLLLYYFIWRRRRRRMPYNIQA
jgi:hypothetical protein